MSPYAEEFPVLTLIGLYAAEIRGDGNCLFNALSDQMYGTQDQHASIRAGVIDYMRNHAPYYKQFLEVYPGGGTRRNPKRKNAGSYAASNASSPSPADVDRVFEEHVTRMARGGVWGDNMEIQAFAAAFDCNIKIYQREFAYVVSAPGGEERPYLHIAYHTWEHYSSVRNLDGPHHGLPKVTPKPLTPAEEEERQAKLSTTGPIPKWQIDSLTKACPTADTASITRALEETRGNIDAAYEKLMAMDELRSISSQQSSSVEREGDGDDDLASGPNKRQDRRLSRHSKAYLKAKQEQRYKEIGARFDELDDSYESLVNITSASPLSVHNSHVRRDSKTTDASDDDDAWTPDPLNDGDTSSGSEYSTPGPSSGSQSDARIKLSPGKADFLSPSKPAIKLHAPGKRLMSAREKKDVKKQAQKQAAKARKQLATAGKKPADPSAPSSIDSSSNNSLHPAMAATAMRTLYI